MIKHSDFYDNRVSLCYIIIINRIIAFVNAYSDKKRKTISIITDSLTILLAAEKYQIPCILSGGSLNGEERCMQGKIAENFFREIYTDTALIPCSAISDDGIVTENNPDTAEITKIAFKNAQKSITCR